jgi:hypothetical protein
MIKESFGKWPEATRKKKIKIRRKINIVATAEFRVARWFILRPNIPIWVYFGELWNGKCWYILRPFGKIYGHSV